jgi:hypothetical protein
VPIDGGHFKFRNTRVKTINYAAAWAAKLCKSCLYVVCEYASIGKLPAMRPKSNRTGVSFLKAPVRVGAQIMRKETTNTKKTRRNRLSQKSFFAVGAKTKQTPHLDSGCARVIFNANSAFHRSSLPLIDEKWLCKKCSLTTVSLLVFLSRVSH